MTDTVAKAVDPRTAAGMYGVGYSTIRAAVNTGALRARRNGRRILIDTGDLSKWFDDLPDA